MTSLPHLPSPSTQTPLQTRLSPFPLLTLSPACMQSLEGIKNSRGVPLISSLSSEWTQEDLDAVYEAWHLRRPTHQDMHQSPTGETLARLSIRAMGPLNV